MQRSTKIREITPTAARAFYDKNHEPGDHVSFSDKGKYFAYVEDADTRNFSGIISTQHLPSSIRIKTFLVHKKRRNKGIGSKLLRFVVYDGIKYTAFATTHSRPLFEALGFVAVSQKPNGISYMIKQGVE